MNYKIPLVAALFSILTVCGQLNASSIYSMTKDICGTQNKYKEAGDPYTVRLCIAGIWFLVSYDSDGYIINIVEDDE